jgi:hypothetical protein
LHPTATLSRKKKACFAFVTVLVTLALIELLSWFAILWIDHDDPVTLRNEMERMSQGGTREDNSAETIHPYLGWVMNPQVNPGTDFMNRHIPVNSLGFDDFEHGIPKRRPDRLIVAICGGSVAWQMTVAGEQVLVDKLHEHPLYRDKEIQLIRLAVSGYKQPQQLLALNFLLALGAEFDVLVNIDGYNEVALAVAENAEAGVFVAYPRRWDARMQDVVDPRVFSLSYRLLELRATRQQLAAARMQSALDWSPTLNLIWYLRNKRLRQQVIDLGAELREHKDDTGFGFPRLGPAQLYHGQEELYRQVVELWSNCSLQMHRLCRENGIRYLHFLQPNQHFPESKPMGAAEKKIVFGPINPRPGKTIPIGYPLLVAEGKNLREKGISFYDLTMLFKEIETPIYVDACCHYNQQGYDLLAAAVATRILEFAEGPAVQLPR